MSTLQNFHVRASPNAGNTHFNAKLQMSNAPQNSKPSLKKKSSIKKQIEEPLDAEEVRMRNQRYMDVLRDLARLRDHYYSVYLTKLEAKVEKQRKEIVAREEILKIKLLNEEKRKAIQAHKLTHRLPKHKLKNDTEFLRSVPKSRYYHLVAVEELMKSRGLLKRKCDIEDFWSKVTADQSFWMNPVPRTISPDTLTEHMLSRYSSLTTYSKLDQSVPEKIETLPKVPPLPGILKQTVQSNSEENTPRPETPPLVFPEQPKFPKLHSFNAKLSLELKSKTSIASSVESTHENGKNIKHVGQHRRKLFHHIRRDAYNNAVVKTAMSGRLLERHGLHLQDLHPLSEITAIWCSDSEKNSVCSSKDRVVEKGSKISRSRKLPTKAALQSDPKEIQLSTISELPAQETDAIEKQQPLSMEMMLSSENLSVMEAQCPSTLWMNYTQDDVTKKPCYDASTLFEESL